MLHIDIDSLLLKSFILELVMQFKGYWILPVVYKRKIDNLAYFATKHKFPGIMMHKLMFALM